MRNRALALALAAVAAVVGMRIASGSPDRIPLVIVPQGISVWSFDGERVFLAREGTLTLTGYLGRAPDTDEPLRWCPISRVFLAVEGRSIWDPQGRYVAGPASRDLTTVAVTVDEESQRVAADPAAKQIPQGRGDGTISGEAKLIYDNWIAGRIPLGIEFCRNALQ